MTIDLESISTNGASRSGNRQVRPATSRDNRCVQPQLLIVEDDSDLREVLVRSVAAEGFAVEAVATSPSGARFVVTLPHA
jgi:hypothetical protein